jgi:acyl carrier protein
MSEAHEATLEVLARMIREIIGEDWDLEQPISTTTSFSQDLELESIEFVALAEKLQQRYAGRVDFVSWLSAKQLDEIIALRVGDLAEYIDRCLSSEPTA